MEEKRYKILWGRSIEGIENLVNEYIDEGFVPIGGPFTDSGIVYQAMYNENSEK